MLELGGFFKKNVSLLLTVLQLSSLSLPVTPSTPLRHQEKYPGQLVTGKKPPPYHSR